MKALLQRVLEAQVSSEEFDTVSIGHGLLIFLGVAESDTEEIADKMAAKVLNLRMFDGSESKFDKSLLNIDGEALVVSQFTLFADSSRGRRPTFFKAAKPEKAKRLYDYFSVKLKEGGLRKVEQGPFGARMIVDAKNQGPFSIPIDLVS